MESQPWVGMFVNYQFHIHAQSFFISFDRSVFSSTNFTNFWTRYFPTDFRHKVIKKGEIRLTQVLMDSGFSPYSYIKADLIETSTKFDSFSSEEKFALWSGFGFVQIDLSPTSVQAHVLQFRRIFTILNPSHHLGIIATRVLGAPLKLDLLRTGLVSLGGLIETARNAGVEHNELKEFEVEFSSKGSNASSRGIHKLWRTFGLE